MAVFIAAFILSALAIPSSAISKAVPCAGEVLMIGRPSVTLTAVFLAISLMGIIPWSWYIATTPSNSPATAFVNDLRADLFDARTVYAALDNHKFGDFKPYLIKSMDAGKSWKSIAGNIPDRTLVWRLVQDHVKKDLLFAATEFGIYFTVDGGSTWVQLKGGVPTISFRDITIQRRENDLVAASFGRGFFILDDLTPLRDLSPQSLQEATLFFPVKDSWLYQPRSVAGDQGASDYRAENPPFGAV